MIKRLWNGRTSLSFVWSKEYETVEKVCPLSDHWQHASLLTFQLLWSQVWKCWQGMDTLVLSIIYMACNRRPLSPWWPCTCPAIYSNDLLHVFCNLLQPRIMWSCVFSRFSSLFIATVIYMQIQHCHLYRFTYFLLICRGLDLLISILFLPKYLPNNQ